MCSTSAISISLNLKHSWTIFTMDKAQQLAEQWEDFLLQTQHEFELMLQDITTSRPSLDHLLLGRVTMHHMSQLHESIAALSKALVQPRGNSAGGEGMIE